MPSVLWVSLKRGWKLEEVQAGLQVVIALSCTAGIFAFSRFCWQLSSNLVKRNRAVALASLMSISTIGEAFDIIALLKRRIFRQRYWKLLAQSIVVIALTVSTIVSGPIAKASTRMGSVIRVSTVPGLLATRNFNSRAYATVDWNETMASLNKANFPLNQLLDFMPQPNSSWVYKENEWNNTWMMDCNKTDTTPVTLYDTGNCTDMSTELPATSEFFPYDTFATAWVDWHALYTNGTRLDDGLVILTGWSYPGWDNVTKILHNMTVTVVSMHIHGMAASNDTKVCNFGRGPVESASYTKMECFLNKSRPIPDAEHVAYPEAADYFALSAAYISNYFDRFATESNERLNISVITPDELIRFYQTYIVQKDLQYPHRVERPMTTDLSVVQLSSTFIAFGSLYILIVILGVINFGIFAYRNRDVIRDTPVSKLDWIVQSILDESEALKATGRAQRRSVVAPNLRPDDVAGSEKLRTVFENAKYGASTVEEVPLTHYASPQAGSIYNQSPSPAHGFEGVPTAYGGYVPEQPDLFNMNPYEASYASHQMDGGMVHELQNPQQPFISNQRRGYQRLG